MGLSFFTLQPCHQDQQPINSAIRIKSFQLTITCTYTIIININETRLYLQLRFMY